MRAFIDTLSITPLPPEEDARARLRAAGLLGETGPRAATGRACRTPIEIKGKPLSGTLIGERR